MLAHAGGWDEILLVAVPILILMGILYLAGRRASARARSDDVGSDSAELSD